MSLNASSDVVERWGIFELSLEGPEGGNPFLDVTLKARFEHGRRVVEVDGFYDGAGVYRARFMPDATGVWSYVTESDCPALEGHAGEFTCVAPSPGNRGPVGVRDRCHFAYADGSPYFQVGTTCYAWIHQSQALQERTLLTLQETPFNKLRMCVFPKHYLYNEREPLYYPFQPADGGTWDFTRFNPRFFRHLEGRVGDLLELGIEADLILFHPYDRWGFATMGPEADDFYLRYVVARLAAYRNVWWSMANEYDLMEEKSPADWSRLGSLVQERDPYGHLRSIHNCRAFYDHREPWVTHVSVQHSDLERVREWRELYGKPVVVDECRYEGDVEHRWGCISARELVHRFWLGAVGGGYVGHGETYLHPEDVLWWSHGGVLHGQSPQRIAFLREILEDGPAAGFEPVDFWGAKKNDEYYLYYYGVHQPARQTFHLPPGRRYRVDVIDPWDMTIAPLEGVFTGTFTVRLPGRPYLAVRIRSV